MRKDVLDTMNIERGNGAAAFQPMDTKKKSLEDGIEMIPPFVMGGQAPEHALLLRVNILSRSHFDKRGERTVYGDSTT